MDIERVKRGGRNGDDQKGHLDLCGYSEEGECRGGTDAENGKAFAD